MKSTCPESYPRQNAFTKLTESMLTLNSPGCKGYLSRTNFDINRVIKDTASFEGTCESKNISFDLDLLRATSRWLRRPLGK